jgi:hypothetical protein
VKNFAGWDSDSTLEIGVELRIARMVPQKMIGDWAPILIELNPESDLVPVRCSRVVSIVEQIGLQNLKTQTRRLPNKPNQNVSISGDASEY